MILTLTQMGTLRTLIDGDSAAHQLAIDGDDVALAAWLNAPEPDYIVYRSAVGKNELRLAVLAGAVDLDNLSVGKRDSLLWVCSDVIDPSKAATRQAILDLTIRTSGGASTLLRGALDALLRRNATRAEKALATGAGTSANPALLGAEGLIDYGTASQIRS